MKTYAGMKAIRDACFPLYGTDLGALMGKRVEELSAYAEFEDPSFLRVLVLEVSDEMKDVNSALGFDLFERNCDAVEDGSEWFELTLVLSDEGAGVIVYVRKDSSIDPLLLCYCRTQMDLLSS